MGGRGQVGPRGLCAYLVEVQDKDGITTVPDKFTYLVRKCIEDKVFSENRDHITVCRTDSTTSLIEFGPANWESLRKGLKALNSTEVVGAENPVNCIGNVVDAMIKQTENDTYDDKKILFFADLSSYILEEDDLVKLADKLLLNDIFLSMVLPNKVTMNDLQLQNSRLLKNVFKAEKFEEVTTITNLTAAERQIVNTQTKKVGRPAPWNCPLEITSDIAINVSGFVCTRKNKMGEMTRVLMKQVDSESRPLNSQRQLPSTSAAGDTANSSNLALESANKQDKTVVVEVAKNVLGKEQIWTDNDGDTVAEEDIGKAYYFGDKLIPFGDVEGEDSYKSGNKCLKVLVFCPPENINPAFHTGDGTTLFYPKKDDVVAEVMFKSLMQAMVNSQRIAVVRKVYLKDKKVTIGTLVPDLERKCLVFTELCFADDVSIPQFPLLIKQEEIENNENVETNEKEDLIDELIKSKTLDSFSPSDGPVDPAVFALRERISSKIIINDSAEASEATKSVQDNLTLFFQSLPDSSDLLLQIRNSFPLIENQIDTERLAGKNVFRKRELESPSKSEGDTDKKPKLEIKNEADEIEKQEDANDIDDLLDEL